jgi:cytochrome b involved in lipid metabolism
VLRPDRNESATGVENEIATSSLSTEREMKEYTSTELASHKDAKSCYTAINGAVYDLTSWIELHPGGAEAILVLCGRDGTKDFLDQHGKSEEVMKRLPAFKVGALK